MTYDYLIVGAGSAGAILVARLITPMLSKALAEELRAPVGPMHF